MTRELTSLYVHSGEIGYGRTGVELSKALEDRGVRIYDSLGEGPRYSAHPGRHAPPAPTNTVLWTAPPSHAFWWYEGQHRAILTMYETDQLPETFTQALHNFETIIVPSEQNVELFGRYHENVHLMPLGVDPARWHYTPRKAPERYFNFLIGGSGTRKGTDLAYRAFQRVFGDWKGDGPEPRLVMKNPRGEPFHGPRIVNVNGRISAEQEIAVYEDAHCYVQPSRGEGFGLQPLQALAQGIPTILTNAHGHAGYAHLGIPIPAELADAAYFIYGQSGRWWEPDFEALCGQMEYVYDHWLECEFDAGVSAKIVALEWTWANSASRLEEILGDELEKPYTGSGAFGEPDQLLYEAVLLKDWTADIGGTRYVFQRGVPQVIPADVKRILFEADLLDPVCVSNGVHDGIAADQAARLNEYRKAHVHCRECGQALGGRDRGDELAEQAEAVGPWQDAVYAAVKEYPELLERVPAVQEVLS